MSTEGAARAPGGEAVEAPLTITMESFDGGRLLAVRGELDLSTVDQLRSSARRLVDEPGSVAVDLTECAFLDSSGIRGLVDIRRDCDANGRGFVLIAQGQPAQVIGITSLDAALNLTPTREKALAGYAASE
jgi:anti-anti-sigma factor